MARDPEWFLRRWAADARRWWWIVLAFALIGAFAGHLVAPRMQSYRASTTILVGVPTDVAFVQQDDLTASDDTARVLAAMIPQQRVLQGVASQLSLGPDWRALSNRVGAGVIGHSNRLIAVSATASSPQEATAIVGAIPGQLAAAAFPTADADENRAFLWARIDAIRDHIAATERLARSLQRHVRADPGDSAAAARLAAANSLIDGWDASLASMYRELQGATSVDHLQVLEEPTVTGGPFPSELRIDLVGALVAAIVASVAVSTLGWRYQRRSGEVAVLA